MTQPHPQDEISLRDLYLILRRGLPLIVIVSVLAAALAFVLSSLLPKSYQAEATVQVNPLPVSAREGTGQEGAAFDLSPRLDITFEAYEAIAFSTSVVEAALADVPELSFSPGELRNSVSLRKLIGPQQPTQVAPLTVAHEATTNDPALAARLADSWALRTIEVVQSAQLASLAPIRSATTTEADRLLTRVTELEEEWATFQARDDSSILQRRLDGLTERIGTWEQDLDVLERTLRRSVGRQTLLTSRLEGLGETARPGEDQVAALEREGLIGEATFSLLEQLLRQQPEAGLLEQDLLRLTARASLQNEQVATAGILAERDLLRTQLEDFKTQADAIRGDIARLEQERTQLERTLTHSRDAYEAIVVLEPAIDYLAEVVPSSSQLLSEAALPTSPAGPRRLLNTALALVLVGLLATLYVFLREAVAAPRAPTGAGTAPAGDRTAAGT